MTLTLSESTWNRIYHQIIQDYGQTTIILSWRLRETLGFTVRRHQWFNEQLGYTDRDIRLDFDTEAQVIFFKLKYL